jgi:hypothetical protein
LSPDQGAFHRSFPPSLLSFHFPQLRNRRFDAHRTEVFFFNNSVGFYFQAESKKKFHQFTPSPTRRVVFEKKRRKKKRNRLPEMTSVSDLGKSMLGAYMRNPWLCWGVGPNFALFMSFSGTAFFCEWCRRQPWCQKYLITYTKAETRAAMLHGCGSTATPSITSCSRPLRTAPPTSRAAMRSCNPRCLYSVPRSPCDRIR